MRRDFNAHMAICGILIFLSAMRTVEAEENDLEKQARIAMDKAAAFYHSEVATHGGYVYFYSPDLNVRWGEGSASKDQIWVQPPGTPTVGLAFLRAYEATGDRQQFLIPAVEAAEALVYGQMKSGGWTNCVDFDPRGTRVAMYRNGKGRGRNISSLDDGQSQSAILLLIHIDHALDFKHDKIHNAARIALDALLAAQFPNGAFPQVWDDDVIPDPPNLKASYPNYEWRTEGRIKNYWDMYTLNDNVTGYVADVLIDAHEIYDDSRFQTALRRLGDFLIAAQMPDPQPGWAQQYNYDMQPIWARKFEPPGVAGDESQEAIETLMKIFRVTGDRRYLAPIPRAIDWLKQSRLPDGRLARYYELQTNRPLYMTRNRDVYTLTYDDSNLPKHYGWKIESRLDEVERSYKKLVASNGQPQQKRAARPEPQQIKQIIGELDEQGRWISTFGGERLVGQPKFAAGAPYLSSEVFSKNLTQLSEFVREAGKN